MTRCHTMCSVAALVYQRLLPGTNPFSCATVCAAMWDSLPYIAFAAAFMGWTSARLNAGPIVGPAMISSGPVP